MIICRTPFRLSFFGGGTDYPSWYMKHGGEVLATSIDKYCYITCRYLPPFFDHKIRIVYSKIENCGNIDEITHPAVREILRFMNMSQGVEIHHDGDLPARSGIGSSSSFTVGLLNSLYALKGKMVSKERLMLESIHVEQNLIKETVGSQDQATASFGGFNHIKFSRNGEISVIPVTLRKERLRELNDHLMLFFTGINRTASTVAESYLGKIGDKDKQLNSTMTLLHEALSILNCDSDIKEFGFLLDKAWKLKKSISPVISNGRIDNLYKRAVSSGAIGGKITGAGGGGFLLLFAPPDTHDRIRNELKELIYVPFGFEPSGSQIIFYDPEKDYNGDKRVLANSKIVLFEDEFPII